MRTKQHGGGGRKPPAQGCLFSLSSASCQTTTSLTWILSHMAKDSDSPLHVHIKQPREPFLSVSSSSIRWRSPSLTPSSNLGAVPATVRWAEEHSCGGLARAGAPGVDVGAHCAALLPDSSWDHLSAGGTGDRDGWGYKSVGGILG